MPEGAPRIPNLQETSANEQNIKRLTFQVFDWFKKLIGPNETDNKFKSPEKKVVTPRSYSTYLEDFRLPQEELKGKKILDVGSGLSTFAAQTQKKFGDERTFVVPLDPIYSFLGNNLDELKENLQGTQMEVKALIKEKDRYGKPLENELEKRYETVQQTSNKVAGSHQHLPFAENIFDLVLAHNSVLQYEDRNITKQALEEIIRVLNKHGEIRILPLEVRIRDEGVYLPRFETNIPEKEREAERLGLQSEPDRRLFNVFKEIENLGATLYIVSPSSSGNGPRGASSARTAAHQYCLIIRQDSELPKLKDEGLLSKLSFNESVDGVHIPRTILKISTEDSTHI